MIQLSVKQQALNKMLAEMQEKHTAFEDRVHNWLCDQTDDWLFIGVMKEDKSIKGSMQYCRSKAKKLAESGVAVVEDDKVFSWVREYFLNEEKEPAKEPVKPVEKIVEQIKEVEPDPEDEQLNLFDFD